MSIRFAEPVEIVGVVSVIPVLIFLKRLYRLLGGIRVLYILLSAGFAACVTLMYTMIGWPALVLTTGLCIGTLCAYTACRTTSAWKKFVLINVAIAFFILSPLVVHLLRK